MLIDLGTWWALTKNSLAARLSLTHWELHVLVGLAGFGLTILIFRRWWPSWWLLLPIAILEAGNEIADFLLFYSAGMLSYWIGSYALIEIALTLAPASLILWIATKGRGPAVR